MAFAYTLGYKKLILNFKYINFTLNSIIREILQTNKKNKYMTQAARIIGTGLATTGLIGAGVGIGVVFGALILGVAIISSLRGQLFSYAVLGFVFGAILVLFALMKGFLLSDVDTSIFDLSLSIPLGEIWITTEVEVEVEYLDEDEGYESSPQ